MAYSGGLISAPVSIRDISKALGIASRDLGTLCTSGHINIFSKRKPNELTGYGQPTQQQLETDRYGISAIATSILDDLATMSLGWTYHGAQAPYFRQLDFNGYYNAAPVPFMQANGSRLVIDVVANNPFPALFYMLMASGALANKPFSTASGIGTGGTAVPAGVLGNCICVEEIGFDEGGGTYHSIIGAYLGIVVFQGTTYKGEAWASSPVAISQTRDNDMFIVQTSGLSLPTGEYTAVACAKVTEDGHTFYLPVFNDADYPTRFTLEVGGVGYYGQMAVGVAASAVENPMPFIKTTVSTVYVTMRLTNNSGATLVVVAGNNAKFTLVCGISGRVVDRSGEHDINRTVTTASIYRPTNNQNVPAGESVDLTYAIPNVWNLDELTQPDTIESGRVTLSPVLKYGGTDAYPTPFGRVLGITYGTL